MKKTTTSLIRLIAFAAFLLLSVWVYNTLAKKVRPDQTLKTTSSTSSNSTSSAHSAPTPSVTESEASLPPRSSDSVDEKVPAPEFTAYDQAGNAVKLSDYFGKPIVLNFWASWCPPCKREMPHFEEVYGDRKDDIQFLMVNMVDGQRETKEKGEAFIAEQEYQFPVLYDTDQEAAYTYGVNSIPTTYFVDKEGYVIAVAEGQIDKETLLLGIGMIE